MLLLCQHMLLFKQLYFTQVFVGVRDAHVYPAVQAILQQDILECRT